MKIILKTVSTWANENCEKADYALVDVDHKTAELLGRRIKQWAAVKAVDEALYGLTFWDYNITLFGYDESLDNLPECEGDFCAWMDENDFVFVSDNTEIPDGCVSKTDAETVVISGATVDGCNIHWNVHIHYSGIQVETETISLKDIYEALKTKLPSLLIAELEEEPKTPEDAVALMVDAIFGNMTEEQITF